MGDPLVECQWELDGYLFGGPSDPVGVADLDQGSRLPLVQDTHVGRTGALVFGRDIDTAPEWVFILEVDAPTGRAMLDTKAAFRAAWGGPLTLARAESTLRYRVGGETWRVYGRPRRFTDLTTREGLNYPTSQLLASFQLASPLVFSDTEEAVTGSGTALVGGFVPTPATVVFTGPATNPALSCPHFTVGLTGDLAAGESVTLDGRTVTARTHTGAPAGGRLTPATRLAHMLLPPGETTLTHTGGGSVTTRWRNARHTL